MAFIAVLGLNDRPKITCPRMLQIYSKGASDIQIGIQIAARPASPALVSKPDVPSIYEELKLSAQDQAAEPPEEL
jgi:hypothetical protein